MTNLSLPTIDRRTNRTMWVGGTSGINKQAIHSSTVPRPRRRRQMRPTRGLHETEQIVLASVHKYPFYGLAMTASGPFFSIWQGWGLYVWLREGAEEYFYVPSLIRIDVSLSSCWCDLPQISRLMSIVVRHPDTLHRVSFDSLRFLIHSSSLSYIILSTNHLLEQPPPTFVHQSDNRRGGNSKFSITFP